MTAPDAILTCATSQIAIGGTEAVAVPVGCLTEYNGEWVKVTWLAGVSTELTQQTDGNLVVDTGNGLTWSAGTTFKDNPEGPGCLAQFQSSAGLVVSNCDGTSIWNSGAHAYPDAVLAFQADGNVVIYETSAGTALWSSKTNSIAVAGTPDVSQTQVRADFNGDGRSDIAYLYNQTAEGANDTSVWVQTANTTGGFNSPDKVWDSGVGNFDWDGATLLAGDFNGDGKSDLAIFYNQTGEGSEDVSLFLLEGTGTGTFNTTNGIVPNKVWDSGTGHYVYEHMKPVVGDFNGDGRSDIAYLYNQTAEGIDDTSVWVQTANTTGGFNSPDKVWDSGVGNFDWDGATLLAGDFNGDGDSDIAVLYNQTAEGANDISLYLLAGTGAGTFNTTNGNAPSKVWDSGVGQYDYDHMIPVVGDFNGDGRSDIAYLYNQTAEGANDTSVWVQTANTTGGFNSPNKVWDSGVGNFDWDHANLATGDFNGDGDSDIAVLYNQTAEGANDISLYLLAGTGAGTFNTTNGNVPNKVWDSGTGQYDWDHIQLG